jgi:predicted methyltransferase
MNRRHFGGLSLAALASLAMPKISLADAELDALISGPLRSPNNVARDRYRHPAALLEFFGVRDDLTLIEVQPGGGYWTEILGPYLKNHGTYIAAIPARPPAFRAFFVKKFMSDTKDFGKITLTGLDDGKPVAPAGSVDMVLSFRNLHDWMAEGTTDENLQAFYDALKPGGIFGLEDHRANPDAPQDPKAKSGYVRQDYAQELIEKAGFKFIASSEIGANPKDTKNYPDGVWTLPPVLRLGDKDRAKYLAIGESDRFTMKFVKPA